MPSFADRRHGPALLVVVTMAAAALAPVDSAAQASNAADLYRQALAREGTLRAELGAGGDDAADSPSLLTRLRTLVGAYEDISRLFPSSGYSDNALWQGGMLAGDAFGRFGEPSDRARAIRLLTALAARFPTSSRAPKVPAEVARLRETITAAPRKPGVDGAATLQAIRREALPEALRVTLELDREVSFQDERLTAPHRVFIELHDTRAGAAVRDATIAFDDAEVRQARVGRPLNSRIRVVFDLAAAVPYSVYALYNPYRIVIDFERGVTDPRAPSRVIDVVPISRGQSPPAPVREPPPVRETATGSTGGGQGVPAGEGPTASPTASAPAATRDPRPSPAGDGKVSLSRQLGLGVARIVVDPGHGGQDPGAKVPGLTEAGLVLDVALRLEKLLKTQKSVEVVLTRRTNVSVPLETRTAIANKSGADLFLSIHANASAASSARGIETYFLNFAPDPEAEAVAARENAGSSRRMRHLPDIVQAIAASNKRDESRDFAATIQRALYEQLRPFDEDVKDLGVKQAPFMVLVGANMPAVLAEISFMTNSEEAALLKTEKYRQQIAEALFDGIMQYQRALKKTPQAAVTR